MAMRNPGGGQDHRCGDLAAERSAQVVTGDAQFTDVRGQPLTLFRRVLDRMRHGKGLRAEQQESQQEVGQGFLHVSLS